MYIMVLDTVPTVMVPVVVSHASLAFYKKYINIENTSYNVKEWCNNSFRKIVCKVNQKEFDKLKELSTINITTESALDDSEVTITLLSSFYFEVPNVVKFAKLWTP